MRRIISSGSAKGFCLDREEVLKKLKEVSASAVESMPEIREIRLFGSLAAGDETGLSDADVFVVVETGEKNPLERIKPYFSFFSDRLDIAVDIIAAEPGETGRFSELLKDSIVLARRR